MSGVSADQERQIKELAANDNKIAAIARYREITGVGLKEAKEAVEALMLGVPANASMPLQTNEPDAFLENRIKQLLVERKKIEAIEAYREAHHCGLKEAKDAVDLIQAEMRRDGYSNVPSTPVIDSDLFAEEAVGNRRRMIVFAALFLIAIGIFAFFFILRSGF